MCWARVNKASSGSKTGGVVYTVVPRPKTFAGWLTFSSQFPVCDNPSEIFILFSLFVAPIASTALGARHSLTMRLCRESAQNHVDWSQRRQRETQIRKQKRKTRNGKVPRDVFSVSYVVIHNWRRLINNLFQSRGSSLHVTVMKLEINDRERLISNIIVIHLLCKVTRNNDLRNIRSRTIEMTRHCQLTPPMHSFCETDKISREYNAIPRVKDRP